VLPLASTSGTRKHAASSLVGSRPPGQDTGGWDPELQAGLTVSQSTRQVVGDCRTPDPTSLVPAVHVPVPFERK